jgi:hypothetical protein
MMRFQFLTVTSVKMAVFWTVAPNSLVDIDQSNVDTTKTMHSTHSSETNLLKKFYAFYGATSFTAMLTRARYWSLSGAR